MELPLLHIPDKCRETFYKLLVNILRIPDKMTDPKGWESLSLIPVNKALKLSCAFVLEYFMPNPIQLSRFERQRDVTGGIFKKLRNCLLNRRLRLIIAGVTTSKSKQNHHENRPKYIINQHITSYYFWLLVPEIL